MRSVWMFSNAVYVMLTCWIIIQIGWDYNTFFKPQNTVPEEPGDLNGEETNKLVASGSNQQDLTQDLRMEEPDKGETIQHDHPYV